MLERTALLRKGAKAAALLPGLLGHRRRGDVVILAYHRIGDRRSEIELDKGMFAAHMRSLAAKEKVLTLDDAIKDDGEGGVVLTFDDGYRDFYEDVLPLLLEHRLPALLYLATAGVTATENPKNKALTWSQLREAVATGLVAVGSHTHNHVNLARVDGATAEEEIRRSRDLIEEKLELSCRHFAYPWAVGSSQAHDVVQTLFDSAALSAWETNRHGKMERHRLGRIPILRSDGHFFFRWKVRGCLDTEGTIYRAFGKGPWGRL